MKTTQGKTISAFSALAGLSRKPMNSFTAYKLFKLKKALAPVIEFQSEQEEKLVAEHGGQITENGQIMIADPEKRKAFNAAHRELGELECDVDIPGKISLAMKEITDISVADMEALDDFIEWRE